jgi:coenzyme PQQ precursor peptide PqqA
MRAIRKGRVIGVCTSDKCRAGERIHDGPLRRPRKPQPDSETTMNGWLKPHIEETQAGMEVTSYLPAELDFA